MTVLAAIVIAVLAAAGLVWQHRRDHGKTDPRAEAITAASVQPAPLTAVIDTQPGINLADLDECQLILAYTNDLDEGCARLWDAINEHREENP